MFRIPNEGWSIPIQTEETKVQLRARMRARRAQLSETIRVEYATRIAHYIKATMSFKQARTVAMYRAIHGEVDTSELIETAKKQGKTVCFPIARPNAPLVFSTAVRWSKGRFGFQPHGHEVALKEIDLMLVPGLAFCLNGQRLGFGGGHYDRTLRIYSGTSIGLAYPFQICETSIATDPWDIRVNRVVTLPMDCKADSKRI
ncbi:MAG: 5-formyltetrahydrofolate cyclo-ligase [Bradymonadia bacterium]